MADLSAFPLVWPVGRPRTTRYQVGASAFGKHSIAAARDEVIGELDRLGASNRVISTNVPLRKDGVMRGDQSSPVDAGVAVYFALKGKSMVLACDRWNRVEHNLWAVARTIEAQRGISRWGAVSVEQAFAGYAALPERSETESCWAVLGVRMDATAAQIQQAYRDLARAWHPDTGGSDELMKKLNRARDEALAAIRGQPGGGSR